jgi:hypothetical protein
MKTFNADRYVCINPNGAIVFESVWEKEVMSKLGKRYFNSLMTAIEDSIFESDGKEFVNWDKVEGAQEPVD